MYQSCKVTVFFAFIIFLLTLTFALSSLTCKRLPIKQEKPYTFSLVSGSLPPGLTLGSDGIISGTPTTEGTYTFSIKITDSSNPANEVTKEFTLTVGEQTEPLTITIESLPDPPAGME